MVPTKLNDILEFAIRQEEEAADFYEKLAERVAEVDAKQTLREMAAQERVHRERLLKVREKGTVASGLPEVVDLAIGDYLVDPEVGPELTFQSALVLAMKREKAAFRLYSEMAAQAIDAEARKAFQFLAQEEASHKLGLEIQYDDAIFQEN